MHPGTLPTGRAQSKEHRARRIAPARIADFEFRIATFKLTEHKFGNNKNKTLLVVIIGSSRSISISFVFPQSAFRNPKSEIHII
jgi:hypothetical protein